MKFRKFLLYISFLLIPFQGFGIDYSFQGKINWKPVQYVQPERGSGFFRLAFDHAFYPDWNGLPVFKASIQVHTADAKLSAKLFPELVVPADSAETALLHKQSFEDTSFRIKVNFSVARKQPLVIIQVSPVRWNPTKEQYEKLVSFNVDIQVVDDTLGVVQKQALVTDHCVLATGSWFKIRINKSGIYKITYDELKNMGFPLDGSSADIALYGNGGGVLPEQNNIPVPEDLTENPIEVVEGGDGTFGPGDYILFYGQGPVTWNYDASTGYFSHQDNYYSDYAYYFLTLKSTPGKRIQTQTMPSGTPDVDVKSFSDYAYHELDQRNLGSTGRTWYGEVFDFTTSYTFDFNFPNRLDTTNVFVKASLASTAQSTNGFQVYGNSSLRSYVSIPITGTSGYDVGKGATTQFSYNPSDTVVSINLKFLRNDAASVGYLDYIDVNAQRALIFTGNQMTFTKVFHTGSLASYYLTSNQPVQVWDITYPLDAQKVWLTQQSNGYQFSEPVSTTVQRFIAFNGNEYYSPEFVERVQNQDLHAVKDIDYLIVAYPEFLAQAERLAAYHEQKDGLKVYVTTPEKIYNEFSSGAQDITAIRNFVKRLYDISDPGQEIKYLLLFGDASYDYKDRVKDNTNFVPCWESVGSLNLISSIASDDYYGYLDDGEGASSYDRVDIGIGRFPVDNVDEATRAVDKIISYETPSAKNIGPWRNVITFVADDGDNNTHLNDAEKLSTLVQTQNPALNIKKLYLDAFPQESTPSGQRAPALNEAIDAQIDNGTLIFNYSGHGGVNGLGHERFVQLSDINSWDNYNKLSVFITATCEFTAFDNPELVSAGEWTFFNPNGGAVALFTTTRATYASSNLALNTAIYNHNMLEKTGGLYPRFGDVIRRSKILGGDNDKKFTLIGDPALRLNYPQWSAVTTSINEQPLDSVQPDTLKALSKVRIRGEVLTESGQLASAYQGTLFPTIYDKESKIYTLGTDNDSQVTSFLLWKNILFNGKAEINNGKFDFTFLVPKDIAYQYGTGRIAYYFSNDSIDGNGSSENIIVGGFNQQAVEDTTGPEIRLFMNDSTFISGGITDENPSLFAMVNDVNGINTSGIGIGHDIVATLDNNPNKSYNLNAFYTASEGDYTHGIVTYPFQNLSVGEHTLTLKVWDLYNNSSTATINFMVKSSGSEVVEHLQNWPNPARGATDFVFQHNMAGKELKVEIDIYSLDGRKISTIRKTLIPDGFTSGRIHWDGTSYTGARLAAGMYVCRALITAPDGETKSLQTKMVFIP
ncbi:MAG: type IX secretion system sortase PorU [Bacteroidales bacterium]|nr:type IX secretion system sortase PorU [Bacteroidales bacterium]